MAQNSEINLQPNAELVDRFRKNLDALLAANVPVGIAVSGGPDSLALLLLAAAARPGLVEAATVDHALRPESGAEAEMVAAVCEQMGIPHETLRVEWKQKPKTAIQERARIERYRLLSEWARRKERWVVTAHHLDDQAETFLMRLSRGSGVRGLAGMHSVGSAPPDYLIVVRPLLGWRHDELVPICADAGLQPVSDPSNEDEQFERVRVRKALARSPWLNPAGIAASAAHLVSADHAIEWAVDQEWKAAVTVGRGFKTYRPGDAPNEIRRRVVERIIWTVASEGGASPLRGGELDRLLAALTNGQKATLRGVVCVGGKEWRFAKAPPRKG